MKFTRASSTCIAAGINAKALSSYMGHSNIAITFDLYGHLMPGNEAEAADLLDAYLLRSKCQSGAIQGATGAVLSDPERIGEGGAFPVVMRNAA